VRKKSPSAWLLQFASGETDVIVLNFANPDMVGHTGNMDATVTAVEATDVALGIVIDALEKRGGIALITADHGNAEFHGGSRDRPGAYRAHHLSGAADYFRSFLIGAD